MTLDEFLEAVRREDIWWKSFFIDGLISPGDPGSDPSITRKEMFTLVERVGAQWRVSRCRREYSSVYCDFDERFATQPEALDYAWQKIYCDPDNRAGIQEAQEEIYYQLAMARRIWGKRFPEDEVRRMLRDKERELQPLLDDARAKYAKPLCIDAGSPVAGSAAKADT